ncbi:hypothetical protein BpHYR1_017012 [Brachionus plicatilis]|uniref:Transmembrane protein n=1 Tax=Brachionus plicatilis TaxID=10195 RepID=A0A3M7PYY4_BRAPC|nr:hypothetical protein BpHYR1_017012 [Brachionus plicatilis]
MKKRPLNKEKDGQNFVNFTQFKTLVLVVKMLASLLVSLCWYSSLDINTLTFSDSAFSSKNNLLKIIIIRNFQNKNFKIVLYCILISEKLLSIQLDIKSESIAICDQLVTYLENSQSYYLKLISLLRNIVITWSFFDVDIFKNNKKFNIIFEQN